MEFRVLPYKWVKRYKLQGSDGLIRLSSKPISSPLQKRDATNEQLILSLSSGRKLGVRRIQSELRRLYSIILSLSTIHKTLHKHAVKPLSLKRHYRKKVKCYNCRYPAERIQKDVCKISNKLHQYTAIDDCLFNSGLTSSDFCLLDKNILPLPVFFFLLSIPL